MSEINISNISNLMKEYDTLDSKVDLIKNQLDQAIKERSECVRRVLEANDNKKKIRRNGKELTIVIRGDTYFFRGSKSEATEI